MKMKTDTKELRKEMAEKGITTIAELSEKTGINRVTLGKILCGVFNLLRIPCTS